MVLDYRAGLRHPDAARDIPVFDRGNSQSTKAETRIGLGEGHSHVSLPRFQRTDRDRRPGTPLPPEATGDPHPDRLARAETLRQLILAHDNRYRIDGSVDRVDLTEPKRRGGAHATSKTPDIEKPRSYYVDIPLENAVLEARRGDQVLLFPSLSEAARCLTGAMNPKMVKAIQNAAGGITKSAFGWEWTRLKSRRGANR